MSAAMDKVSKARARMLVSQIFFATILLGTPQKESDLNDTAWTDGKVIGFCRAFFDKLTVDAIAWVLCHEVLHIALMHALRRGHRHPLLWNYACDYAINLMLENSGLKMPDDPDRPGKQLGLLDRKYANMSAEQIYDQMKQEVDEERKKRGLPGIEEAITIVFGNGTPMDGDLQETPNLDASDKAEIERQVIQKVAQAGNMAKLAGKLAGDLERLFGDILNPKVPWQELLAQYASAVSQDDESWSRRNRRFKMYLPDRRNVTVKTIGMIGDTSGSISGEELTRMVSEGHSIFQGCAPEEFVLLWADTKVAGEQVFKKGDEFLPVPAGGGGTDMRVPLEAFEERDPDVVILFTDGHTPWPKVEPPYPLIVVCTTGVDVPIGQVVRV